MYHETQNEFSNRISKQEYERQESNKKYLENKIYSNKLKYSYKPN